MRSSCDFYIWGLLSDYVCFPPYNAAIFSTNVRFPLCSLVCFFGKVVLFFSGNMNRCANHQSRIYILQVRAIFDTTCCAHLVILPACHIYRSCVISHILLPSLSFLFHACLVLTCVCFSYIFPKCQPSDALWISQVMVRHVWQDLPPRGHTQERINAASAFPFIFIPSWSLVFDTWYLVLEPFAGLSLLQQGLDLICARDSGFYLISSIPFTFLDDID